MPDESKPVMQGPTEDIFAALQRNYGELLASLQREAEANDSAARANHDLKIVQDAGIALHQEAVDMLVKAEAEVQRLEKALTDILDEDTECDGLYNGAVRNVLRRTNAPLVNEVESVLAAAKGEKLQP